MHNEDIHTHENHDHKCGHGKHCSTQEPITAKTWKCGVPQALGVVMHEGHLYLNLVEGNLADPALGVGSGTYVGAFDLASLITYLINNPTP